MKGKKKTHEEFEQEVFDLVGNEYTILEKYENCHKKILIRHENCGYEYYIAPYDFLYNNKRCAKCSGNMKMNTETFRREVFDLVGDEYTVLEEYKSGHSKLLIKHNICNTNYYVTPNRFLSGTRCPKCSGNMKKNTETFKREVFDLVGDEYTVLEEYKSGHTKIEFIHNKCNNHFFMKPSAFLSDGNRCPKCKRSKGEETIASLLDELGYKYETHISFPNCRNVLPLEFDFQIFKEDGSFILLEYNGIQHYEDSFGHKEDFEKQVKRDKIKERYCKDNSIPLEIIRYDENIEQRLKDIL